MNKGIVAVVVALGISAGALAFAGAEDGPQGPPPPHNPLAWIVESLDLTAEQQAMVDAWREEARAEREEFQADRADVRETMKAELTSGNPNPRTFHKLIDERFAAQQARMHEQVDNFFELYATFTPDQKA
jgi:Spy/CpxP family protein refolding chaperone